MFNKNCKSKILCPVSFGLALGITCGLAMFIWSLWAMSHVTGVPMPMMDIHQLVTPFTWGATFALTLLMFVKGFIFGFVVAIIYDLFACCCRSRCCNAEGTCECECGCSACKSCSSKNTVQNKTF